MASYTFKGRVVSKKTAKGLAGLVVEVWDKDAKLSDSLGKATTDAEGNFSLQFADDAFSDQGKDLRPDLFVKIYSGNTLLHSTEAQPIENWTSDLNPLLIEVSQPTQPSEDDLFTIEGEVVKPDGTPLPDLVVRAYDRTLCEWRPLGDASVTVRTNNLGRFQISYDPLMLQQWGKERADLKVEVRNSTGNTVRAESPLMLRARPQETVNFSIGEQAYRGPDEYSRVERALLPYLEPHDDLNCFEVGDVFILAREAGVPASQTAYYVKARRWTEEYGAEPEMFYALMRSGDSTQIDRLLARPLTVLWRTLKQAKGNNIVDLSLDEATRNKLEQLQNSFLSKTDHPYRKLLNTTVLDDEQRKLFNERLLSGELSGDAFWEALEKDGHFDAPTLTDLRQTFELQSLAADNTSLTLRLRGDEFGVAAAREVAAYSMEQWRDAVLSDASVTIPDEVLPGATPEQRREAYAQQLYRTAELRYPTASLAGQMSRDPTWKNSALIELLEAVPDFDFRDKRLLTLLSEQPKVLDGFADPEAARRELLRIDQLYHLSPSQNKLETIQPLWSAGLRSAPQVAALGASELRRQIGNRLDTKRTDRIYRNAVQVSSMALDTYLHHAPHQGVFSLPVLQSSQLKPEDLPAEWADLFGSADACECSHCESALSPAAYLVDSMAFLAKAVDDAGNNALDELLSRRPDLGSLRLSCENTETPLPHIDLVNEILEAIVTSDGGATLPPQAIGETSWESELLTAQPQYLEPAAYEILRQAVYPFDRLPFDLWTDVGRRYLRQMGLARDKLMRIMPPRDGVGAAQIASDALGLTDLERRLIQEPGVASVAEHWGVAAQSSAVNALNRVERLIDRAKITYDGLLRLLNTRYINADRSVSIDFGATPCTLDNARLVDPDGSALEGSALRVLLDRLHRFLRLQRRLACSEYELDSLIHLLGLADFNAPRFIERLADMQALRETHRLPLLELAAWWGDLDTYAFEDELPSQYEAIFLDDALFPDTRNGAGPDLRNQVFALREDREDLVITASTDATLSPWLAEGPEFVPRPDYAGYIQGATRLDADELQLLVRDWLPRDTTSGKVALNLANLSALYRMASMTRSSKIEAKEALRLFTLTGLTPLSTPTALSDPIVSRQFHDRFVEIESRGHSIEELAYLLLQDAVATAGLAPTTEEIDAWLQAMLVSFVGILYLDGGPEDATVTPELRSAVAQSVAVAIDADTALLEALLYERRPELGTDLLSHLILAANPDADGLPEPQSDFHELFTQLHKFALAWNGLGLDQSLLAYLVDVDKLQTLGWIDIAALPLPPQTSAQYEAWSRLVDAAVLQARLFTPERSLFKLLEEAAAATLAQAEDPNSFVREEFLAQVAEWTGWPLEDLIYLSGTNGFDLELPAAMRDERAFVGLQRVFDLILGRSVAAEQAHRWTLAELGMGEAHAIKQILSLSYTADTWLEVLASIQNPLREDRRDALLGYLLHTLDMPDSDAFYAHYLIDPDASPCGQTSRIVSAHMALQLFVQRILFRLEPFRFQPADADAWRWRENYRVWEAARKVFLWPQNWLLPELRDNKSQFFRELEDALMQEEVTRESAERIYADYLFKLDQVARLEILGLYEDKWVQNEIESSVLHVIGRTREVPAAYFYRRLEEGERWTPWESIDLDLRSEHLIPLVYNGKLYLFSPEFTVTERDEPSASTEAKLKIIELQEEQAEVQQELDAIEKRISKFEGDPGDPGELAELFSQVTVLSGKLDDIQFQIDEQLEIPTDTEASYRYDIELSMAWVVLSTRGSSPKYQSPEKLTYPSNVGPEYHHFVGWVTDESLLRIAVSTSHTDVPGVGYFYFDDARGKLFASKEESFAPRGKVGAFGAEFRYQALNHIYFYGKDPRLELSIGSLSPLAVSELSSAQAQRSATTRQISATANDYSAYTLGEGMDYPSQPRLLLSRLIDGGGQIHYLHQYGSGGIVGSPFFFSTNERCYFVRPQIAWDGKLVSAPNETVSARSAIREARGARSVLAQSNHVESNEDQILDRAYLGAAGNSFNAQAFDVEQILSPDWTPTILAGEGVLDSSFGYSFTRFYDPYTGLFLRQISRHGVAGLLSPDQEWDDDSINLYRQLTPLETFSFKDTYAPDTTWVDRPYPKQEIDFGHDSPCGGSNWELFFHIPMLIATRLMENQRYAEARQWLHHIFDPTCDDGENTERFWKLRPFYEAQKKGPLDSLETLLNEGNSAYESQVKAWSEDPFSPHLLARMRTSTYMMYVVMTYLECLLREADLYFSLDTREYLNKAQLLYTLAAEILGERPTLLPAQAQTVLTPNIMLGRFRVEWNGPGGLNPLDALASLLITRQPGAGPSRNNARTLQGPPSVDVSLDIPSQEAGVVTAQGGTSVLDTLLLFCIPHNEKLYEYWDRVEDRLFKIRHCMNLSGQVRQLALFAPRIDPALLVRASAAGLSIEAVLNGLYGPRSPYRFSFLLQKALELCGETRSLGATLLATLEKKDGEELSLLRSSHEVALLESVRALKQRSIEEAEASLAGLAKNREAVQLRLDYYSTLERISRGEQSSLDKQDTARQWQTASEITENSAAVLHVIPNTSTGNCCTSPAPQIKVSFGGRYLGPAAQAAATALRSRSGAISHQANRAGITASYTRRYKDWKLQADLAKQEMTQLDKQILAAKIRLQIAETDLENHDKQIAQAEQVEEFLKLKFTNQQLYGWMVSRLTTVHFQAYQMASQLALQAQTAFQRELGPDESTMSFIRQDNWDSLKKGLLAGELLHQQLRQMESAYLAANQRELEITKPVSLMQLNPKALLELRATGECDIYIPEVAFDLDFPGHYFRRIKGVRISIPCVTGPYTSVAATLRLDRSWTRRSIADPLTDPTLDVATLPQSAIATSTGTTDAGMFEWNFADPRLLPFEGAGAVSDWHLSLPVTLRPFDYDSISDVVIHLSYTARDSQSATFKQAVKSALLDNLNSWIKYPDNLDNPDSGDSIGPTRLVSMRQEFPTALNRLLHPADGQPQETTFSLSKQHFPRLLDHIWADASDEGLQATPLTVRFGDVASDSILLQPRSPGNIPSPMPQLTIEGLSDIDNDTMLEITLRVSDGTLNDEDWKDVYLLLPYTVAEQMAV